jgi:hypothetical protein
VDGRVFQPVRDPQPHPGRLHQAMPYGDLVLAGPQPGGYLVGEHRPSGDDAGARAWHGQPGLRDGKPAIRTGDAVLR